MYATGPCAKNTKYVYYTEILEVNLFSFAYRLFQEDSSLLNGEYAYIRFILFFMLQGYLEITMCVMQ